MPPVDDDDISDDITLRMPAHEQALLQGLAAIARREEEERAAELEAEPEDSQRLTDVGLPPEAFVT